MNEGTVYLIHLDQPIAGRASHYIGWAANPDAGLHYHRKGKGSRFLAEANRLGIHYDIVRVWPGSRELERKLKNRKKSRVLCPICKKVH